MSTLANVLAIAAVFAFAWLLDILRSRRRRRARDRQIEDRLIALQHREITLNGHLREDDGNRLDLYR